MKEGLCGVKRVIMNDLASSIYSSDLTEELKLLQSPYPTFFCCDIKQFTVDLILYSFVFLGGRYQPGTSI